MGEVRVGVLKVHGSGEGDVRAAAPALEFALLQVKLKAPAGQIDDSAAAS